MNTTEFLAISSAIVPDRVAMVFEGRRITYEEVQDRVNRLANALADLGVESGDRVGVLQVNCNEHIEAYFATAKLDAIYVPLNFRARSDELTHMINDSSPKVLLVGERYVQVVRSSVENLSSVQHYIALEKRVEGWHHYGDLIASATDAERFPDADQGDLTVIMFTAGTTGLPKGVMLSHESFSSYVLSNVSPADPDVEERNVLAVPLYHIAGVQAVMAAVYGGRTLVIQRQFEPKQWMELVERERANRAMLVPTMLKALMDHPDFHNHDLSSLEVITYGAAPMPLEVIKRAIDEFPGVHFINAFGQTETAATITALPPEDHLLEGSVYEVDKRLRRLSSIGKPLEDVEVRIVGEDGNSVSQGEVGEIVARGPRLMKGYWNMAEATAETIRGGWLHTGDLGYFDEDGYIFLSGRSRDFINRGGEMISPEEVEQALRSHPAVDETAVIGVADMDWGERVRAIVVLKEGRTTSEVELIEYSRQRLASFKKPESVVFTDEIPRNALGKVLKRVLREQYGQSIEASG
jgi:acyl-CoA synthetase (AMP-forming)/AMP-acid ligase II